MKKITFTIVTLIFLLNSYAQNKIFDAREI